jgi:hypothetical protein
MNRIPSVPAWPAAALVVAALLVHAAAPADAQQGPHGRGAMAGAHMGDAGHQADMQVFHALFDNRARITRQVTVRPDGVESLTESDDPAVAKLIQDHVVSMAARVTEQRPIHQRDPLFREVFRYADRIVMQHERTAKGVKVVETSADPYVAKLIQAHADVVTAFIANGRAEMMKNHPLPQRTEPGER